VPPPLLSLSLHDALPIFLDRDLPGVHGDDICAALVEGSRRSRVLMLTAAATMDAQVDGLDRGADDYLSKPFDFPVLVARIGALRSEEHTSELQSRVDLVC